MTNDCQVGDDDNVIYVGLGGNGLNTVMIIISCFGILINSIFSVSYLRKIYKNKNKGISNVSSVEKTLCMVAVIETFISIGWLINNTAIKNTQQLKKDSTCTFCKILAHFEIFFYIFDWMILSSSLYQIKAIILNPQKILERKTFRIHMLIASLISLLSFVFSWISNIGGVSPMLTCFLNIYSVETTVQHIFICIFFILPIICFSYGGYQVYLIMRSSQYKNDKQLFREYSYFIFTYIFFALILIFCYAYTYIYKSIKAEKSDLYNFIITVCTLLSCSAPLIVGILRIFRTGFLKKLFSKKQKGVISDDKEKLLNEEDINEGGRINDIEKKLLEKMILKIFIAVSFALGKSKYIFNDKEDQQEDNSINSEENKNDIINEYEEYKITKSEILKDLDLSINEDIKVLKESNIDIQITEYNISLFKKLRQLEGLNEDKIISMFQPKQGTVQLIKKIKDTIYLNSINKLLMLKQVKKEILMFYQRNILPDLYNYLVNHPNSIICRVFGLYKISIDHNEDIYMALMYNTNDSLETYNKNLLGNNEEVKQMKINEQELKRNIIIDSKRETNGTRNFTISLPKNKFEGNINIGGSATDLDNKIFKIFLSDYENDKLTNIIDTDTKFLRAKNLFGFN